MGTQGEIYNMLGIKVVARVIRKDKTYKVLEKIVAGDDDVEDKHDFFEGIPTQAINLESPELVVRIIGHDFKMKGHHFGSALGGITGEALIGYPIANQSYIASATELPPSHIIEGLKPCLVNDIKKQWGYSVKENKLKLYLVYDFAQ